MSFTRGVLSALGKDALALGAAGVYTGRDASEGLRFVSVEDVFAALDTTPGAQWSIDRMRQRATEEPHV